MKMKYLSLCVALGFALAAFQSPAFAADKDKKAAATPAKTTSAPKVSADKAKPAAPVSAVKEKVKETVKETVEVPKAAVPVEAPKVEAPAPTVAVPVPAPAPQAKESTSFFKRLFGSKEKPSAAAPQVPAAAPAPMPNAMRGPDRGPSFAPPPPPSPAAQRAAADAAATSFENDLSLREKAVDSKALDRAKSVAKLFNEKERLKGALNGTVMMFMPQLSRENEGQMEKVQKSIGTAVEKIAEDQEDLVVKNKAVFLAQTFTADELSQLEKFYESSVGQKLIKSSDEIARNDAMFAHRLVMMQTQKTREAVLKEIKRNDLKVPKGME